MKSANKVECPLFLVPKHWAALCICSTVLALHIGALGCTSDHWSPQTYPDGWINPVPGPAQGRILRWVHPRICEFEYTLPNGTQYPSRAVLIDVEPYSQVKNYAFPEWTLDYYASPPVQNSEDLAHAKRMWPEGATVIIHYPFTGKKIRRGDKNKNIADEAYANELLTDGERTSHGYVAVFGVPSE